MLFFFFNYHKFPYSSAHFLNTFSKPKPKPKPKRSSSTIEDHHHQPYDEVRRSFSHPTAPIMLAAAVAASASSTSWLRSRRIRYLFLFLCSPILLPFLCATFPLLCAAELCLRLCRRSRGKIAEDSEEEDRLRRCEEGCCGGRGGMVAEGEQAGLLQRYLEDQLVLVGSMYDCGDDDGEIEDGFDSGNDDSITSLLN